MGIRILEKYNHPDSPVEQYIFDFSGDNKSLDLLETLDDDKVIARAYCIMEARAKRLKGKILESPDAVKDIFRLRHSGLKHETFDVAYLTNRHALLEVRTLFAGTTDSAAVYPREIMAIALELGAAAIVVSHGHPSGIAEPSRADIEITKAIKKAGELLHVRLLDHIITAEGYAVSLAERGEM